MVGLEATSSSAPDSPSLSLCAVHEGSIEKHCNANSAAIANLCSAGPATEARTRGWPSSCMSGRYVRHHSSVRLRRHQGPIVHPWPDQVHRAKGVLCECISQFQTKTSPPSAPNVSDVQVSSSCDASSARKAVEPFTCRNI